MSKDADASPEQLAITEINTGILAGTEGWFSMHSFGHVDRDNKQGEYYLTDIVGKADLDGIPVTGIDGRVPEEVMGVNDRAQLAQLERYYQRGLANELMGHGVAVMDPARLDIRGRLEAREGIASSTSASYSRAT